jgi:hypothetical protein
MAFDPKSIATNGYWYTTASEFYARLISWGYIGFLFVPVSVYKYQKYWLNPTVALKLRG